jgi:PAS domain S-box-containing protein
MVEAAPYAMVMVDTAGIIEMVNAQAEAVFGYSRQEMVGQTVEMLIPPGLRHDHPGLRQSFNADPRSRPMGVGRDLRACRKDGSEFYVEIGLNPVDTADGPKVLSAIVDISDRKQKEERIQAALREKDILLGEIHHRVKNNLQLISSLLELQSAQIDDPTVLAMLRDSQNRVRSMVLVHQTLYQSKDFAQVDFAGFLDSLLSTMATSYGMNSDGISLSVDTKTVLLPISVAIPCGLIVNELITNAFKHAFPGGRPGEIAVGLAEDGDGHAVLSVSDDGIGIPDDLVIEQAPTLGLQLVTLLADQLQGTVSIQRAAPTRIALRFPIRS